MNKKLFLLILIAALPFCRLAASENWRFHTNTFLGLEPVSRLEQDMSGFGLSAGQEVFVALNPWLQAGAGYRYLFPREVEGGGRISWQPLYGAVRLMLPDQKIPLYLKAGVGYAFYDGNSAYLDSQKKLTGGLYYQLGGGAGLPFYYTENIRFSAVLEAAYSHFSGEEKTGSVTEKIDYSSFDLLLGLGLSF